jgi:protease I
MSRLEGMRVAALIANGFDETDFFVPRDALVQQGASVELIAPVREILYGIRSIRKTVTVQATHAFEDVQYTDYDAIWIPGGVMSCDELRESPIAVAFVCEMQWAWKPIGAIGHGVSLLVSAALVRGRNITGSHAILDDIENAGGNWTEADTVLDHNLLTARGSHVAAEFGRQFVALLHSQWKHKGAEEEPMISDETRAIISKARIA